MRRNIPISQRWIKGRANDIQLTMSLNDRSGTLRMDSDPDGNIEKTTLDIEAMIAGIGWRWKLILGVLVFCISAAVIGLRIIPPQYEATVQLLIFDPQWQIATRGDQRTPVSDFDTVAINTELEVIKSAALSRRVARELRLDQYPEFQQHSRLADLFARFALPAMEMNKLLEAGGPSPAGPSPVAPERSIGRPYPEDRKIEVAAALLRQYLSVDRVPLSYVLLVSAKATTPSLAQRVAATLVDDYLLEQRETRQKAVQEMALWLKDRLTDLKDRVLDTETAIEKLKSKSGLTDTGKGNIVEQQIADLNTQLMVARTDIADKRARLDQARQLLQSSNSGVSSIPESETSPLITPLRLEQSDLMRREAELRAKFGDRYAGLLALDVQLAGINKSLYEELVRSGAQLQSDFDLALRRERLLEASLQQLTAKQSDSGDTVKLQQLQRIADADSKLYETYLSQYNEIGTRLSLQIVGAKIISPAELPTAPIFPRHQTLIYIGALIFGLAGGMFLALMLEYMQPRVSSSQQVQRIFGHVVVGALPLMREPGRRNAAHITLVDAVRTAPLSPFSEAVRAIRVALRLADRDHAPTVVLVTSCLPGEGKSAVASLLAASSTAAQLRTILVDCDLRGRAVSRNLGKEAPGLGELLAGIADLEDVTVRDAAIGCVLPAGTSSGGPSDLLSSTKMGEIIERLRRDFDYIVLDTPPLLSVIDALALASVADKILLTIDIGQTRQGSIAQAFRLLTPESARIAGVVFNKIPPHQLPKYRFSGYYPG